MTDEMPDDDRRERLLACAELLEAIDGDRTLLACLSREERDRLMAATGRVSRPERTARRKLSREIRRRQVEAVRRKDKALLDGTGLRSQGRQAVFPTPNPEALELPAGEEANGQAELHEARNCYTCKGWYRELHHFYDSLCPECAALNWRKRRQTCDLSGRTALITGARVKIGYQAAIKLLRAGARVIVTTRFPRDAAARYAEESDFDAWRDRLVIHGLDLRHTPSVVALTEHLLATEDRLDFVLNNACQTVRRPPDYYRHLMAAERTTHADLPSAAQALLTGHEELSRQTESSTDVARADRALPGLGRPAELSQIAVTDEDRTALPELFPEGRLDVDLQQVDLRAVNSWRHSLAEVPVVELLEVHLINAVAPFVLNARLKPLMLRVATRDKHIVNVSAMEGQFYRSFKTDKHPHTNMAKAALNMMTRTSAADYVEDGIHMNSVDTGWITDEDPIAHVERKRAEFDFHPPLDHVDAAARICDPIFAGFLDGEHRWGQFVKDYLPVRW